MSVLDDVRAARESLGGAGDASSGAEPDSPTGSGDATEAAGTGTESPADTGGARGDSDAGGEAPGGNRAPRTRDVSGRFTKSAEDKAVAPKVTQKAAPPVGGTVPNAGEAAPVVPVAPQFKAPQSWKQELKDKWGGLPPEVQGEIDRRERETAVALKEASSVRQFAQELHQRVMPYIATLEAYGKTPAEAFGALLQREHQLHSGPMHMRAAAWARAIDQSGVPPEAINQAWTAEPAQPQQSANAWNGTNFDPNKFAQQVTQQVMQTFQAQRDEATKRQAGEEVAKFKEANPWVDQYGLGPRMWGMMQDGMDIQAAYEEACWSHPETRKILKQREDAERAKAQNASTQRARVAASSVRSQPATASESPDEPETILDAVRAARMWHAR